MNIQKPKLHIVMIAVSAAIMGLTAACNNDSNDTNSVTKDYNYYKKEAESMLAKMSISEKLDVVSGPGMTFGGVEASETVNISNDVSGLAGYINGVKNDKLDIPADDLRGSFSRYATGDLLEINLAALKEFFTNCVDTQSSWEGLLDEFEGTNHIPLMTIHKSKGLEFDTTIFMGIDDNAWWSHKPGDAEGLSTFFVALSRAKQRAIFSYCQQRGQRAKVADFYALLASAGVQAFDV